MDKALFVDIRFYYLDIDDYATEYARSSIDSLNSLSVPVDSNHH